MGRTGGAKSAGRFASKGVTGEFLLFAGSTVLSQGSRLGTFLLAARWTSPAEFGVWNALQLVVLYGVVATIGVPNGMARQVPFFLGGGRELEAQAVEDTSLWFTLLISVGGGGLIALAGLLGLAPGDDRASMLALSALFPAWHMYQYVQARLRSRGRFNLVSAQQVIFSVLLPLVTLPLVWRWRVPGFVAGQAITTALLVLLVHHIAGMRAARWPRDWTGLSEIVRIGFPIMLAGLAYGLLISIDRVLVLRFLGPGALGLYTLPILCVTALNLLPAVVSQQMYPRMAYRYGETRDPRSLVPLAVQQSGAAGLVVLPVIIALYVALPEVADSFVSEYRDGVGPARLLLAGLGAIALSGGAGNLLNTMGKQVYYVAVLAFAVVVNGATISASLLLDLGLTGVAGGAAVGYASFTIMVNLTAWWVVRSASIER